MFLVWGFRVPVVVLVGLDAIVERHLKSSIILRLKMSQQPKIICVKTQKP